MKKPCEAPGCGKEFEAVRSTAKFCSPACRVKAARAVKGSPDAEDPAKIAVATVGLMKDRGAPGYDNKVEAPFVAVPASGSKVKPCVPEKTVVIPARRKVESVKAAEDMNALARNVILSKVPLKKVEDDSIEARVKRLEQAMKQYSKKKPQKEES